MTSSNDILQELSWPDLYRTWWPMLVGRVRLDRESLTSQAFLVYEFLQNKPYIELPIDEVLLTIVNLAGVHRVWAQSEYLENLPFGEHLGYVNEFHSAFFSCLRKIDPGFDDPSHRRRGLNTSRCMKSLVGFSNIKTQHLISALHQVRHTWRSVQGRASGAIESALRTNIDELGRNAINASVLAWRTQSSLRRWAERRLAEAPSSQEYVRKIRYWELMNLWFAAQTANEIGKFDEGAALGALLLLEIDSTFANEPFLQPELQEAVNSVCQTVKALGLSVPESMRDGNKFSNLSSRTLATEAVRTDHSAITSAKNAGKDAGATTQLNEVKQCSKRNNIPPQDFELFERAPKVSLAENNKTNPAILYRLYHRVPIQVLTALANEAGVHFYPHRGPFGLLLRLGWSSKSFSDQFRQRLFDINLALDHLRGAFKLLEYNPHWSPTSQSLTELARRLIQTQRLMPIGIRTEKQSDWLDYFAHAWGATMTSTSQDVVIHQSLLGRMTSLAMGARNSRSCLCLMSDEVGIQTGDFDYICRSQWIETIDSIQKHVLGMSTRAVVASIAPRGTALHLLGLAKQCGHASQLLDNVMRHECLAAARELRSLISDSDIITEGTLWNLPKFKVLAVLAKQLLSAVRTLDQNCELLLLAMEPELASIPWNILLRFVGGENVPLVSLIPSLCWFRDHEDTRYIRDRYSPTSQFVAATVEALSSDCMNERESFDLLWANAKRLSEALPSAMCSVIVGHGTPDDNAELPVIQGPSGPLVMEDMFRYFTRPAVFLLSCYGGAVKDKLIADLSGLPGLALIAGCRCMVAPITRPTPEELADLCEVLADPSAGDTLLHRLLVAFKKHPASQQVSLFGDPSIRLIE